MLPPCAVLTALRMTTVDWNATADWLAATAATVAAIASFAVWRRSAAVKWVVVPPEHSSGRYRVVNEGSTARRVEFRLGSASDISDSDPHQSFRRDEVKRGEAITFSNTRSLVDPTDFSVNLTWRTRFGRKRSWSYPLL